MKKITLKKGREVALQRFHPWIFSGAIFQPEKLDITEGELVEIVDARQDFLCIGYYSSGSIAIRVLSFDNIEIDQTFWNQRLQNALHLRTRLGMTVDSQMTNCFRLVHGEGDGVSGLVIDMYGSVAVVQCHAIGIYRQLAAISTALQHIFGDKLTAIYDKSSETLPPQYSTNRYLFGASEIPKMVFENGQKFNINWETGQKTGFFLDQRDNRKLLERYSEGKNVLNAFCYSGGFSIFALASGAESVCSVDVSGKAIDLTNQNVALNFSNLSENKHVSKAEDVLQFLKDNEQIFDVMVVDPPAFAKSVAKRHNAVQAYKRLNAMAIRQISTGGILFTFSCSQVVDRALFYDTITAAAIEAGRKVRVLHHLTQPADHPVNIFHPEGSYLKGLVLEIT